MRTPGKAICLASLVLGSTAFADMTVREEVEHGPVGVGDPIRVQVAVEGAQGLVHARLPSGDFQLLGTSQSSSIEMRSGSSGMETSRNEQFTFTVVARAPGTLTIPAAQVSADGSTLSAQPVQVDVQAGHIARQTAPDDDDPDPFAAMQKQMRSFGLNSPFMQHLFSGDPFADQGLGLEPVEVKPGDVRIVAVPDRRTASVGEQVTVSYYLVTRVPLTGISDLDLPAIDGAATRTIELGKHVSPDQHGDEARILISRKAIFPSAAGSLTIKSASARVIAGNGLGGQEVAVRSSPLTITVTPLPPGPAPVAVGNWALSLTGPDTATAGQPATLRVAAQGTGDLDDLPTPHLQTPVGWKVFPPTTQETPRVIGGRVGGTRTWDFVVLPAKEGDAPVAPVQMATYDPHTHRYATASSSPLTLPVAPAPPAAPIAPVAASATPSGVPSWLGWAVALAALTALVILTVKRTGSGKEGRGNAAFRTGQKVAWGYLEQARALCAAAQPGPFFDALTRALDQLVKDLGAAPKPDASAVAADLRRAGVSPPASEVIQQAIEACRRFAFLGTEDLATMRRTLGLADQAFSALGEATP